jgi:Bacterial Ig-like domain (group 2)
MIRRLIKLLFHIPRTYFFLVIPGALAFSSCGGGGSSTVTPAPPLSPTITSVTVSPASANLLVKATQQFTANVQGTGSFASAVTWYVNDVRGGKFDCWDDHH